MYHVNVCIVAICSRMSREKCRHPENSLIMFTSGTPRLAQRTPLDRTPRAARCTKHWDYWGKERAGLRREGWERVAGLAAVL